MEIDSREYEQFMENKLHENESNELLFSPLNAEVCKCWIYAIIKEIVNDGYGDVICFALYADTEFMEHFYFIENAKKEATKLIKEYPYQDVIPWSKIRLS